MRDLQKVKKALEEIINQDQGTWDKPVSFGVLYTQVVDIAKDALSELETENCDITGSLISIDEAMKLVRATCGLAGDWMQYEKSENPEERASAERNIRLVAVALMAKFELRKKEEEEFNDVKPVIDDLLLQEVYSLREKLKIPIGAVKSYNPEFDDREFTHRLNSVDFDQLMEELNGEEKKPEEDSLFGSALMKDRRQEMVDKVASGTYKKDDEDKMCKIIKGCDEEIPEVEKWELNLCETYHAIECAKCTRCHFTKPVAIVPVNTEDEQTYEAPHV